MTTANDILSLLESMADERQARQLMRFFKTAKGDYGEGDRFLGLRNPQVRLVVRKARLDVPFSEIDVLTANGWHEARLTGFLLLVEEMKAALPRRRDTSEALTDKARRRDAVASSYLARARRANNWDLVDLSAPKILGEWLLHPSAGGCLPDRAILDTLAASDSLWEQRIAMVSTWRLIQAGETADALRLAESLTGHPHDLIHKATGWMLREVGKRDPQALRDFLGRRYGQMSRTTLRYAIEKMHPDERREWLTHEC